MCGQSQPRILDDFVHRMAVDEANMLCFFTGLMATSMMAMTMNIAAAVMAAARFLNCQSHRMRCVVCSLSASQPKPSNLPDVHASTKLDLWSTHHTINNVAGRWLSLQQNSRTVHCNASMPIITAINQRTSRHIQSHDGRGGLPPP
mmetsp:Transcript_15743/g.44153  ORF Transcript_15743/g.44153 Transcript_15743/m.44153 type:complete len:146 (+) Transcript_15743:197-634(+)